MTKDSIETKLAVQDTKLNYVIKTLDSMDMKVSSSYVTNERYLNTERRIKLLEKIVYGAVALILLAVGGAIVSKVLT